MAQEPGFGDVNAVGQRRHPHAAAVANAADADGLALPLPGRKGPRSEVSIGQAVPAAQCQENSPERLPQDEAERRYSTQDGRNQNKLVHKSIVFRYIPVASDN
jgi:hypothetical protein